MEYVLMVFILLMLILTSNINYNPIDDVQEDLDGDTDAYS